MNYFNSSKNKKNQRGLTIIEALVSLVVLSMGLIPALAIISSSIRLSSLIKNNLIAANLAQEGVEVIRSLRDANWFEDKQFDNNLVGAIGETKTWQVESSTNWGDNVPVAVLIPDTSPPLKYDPVKGLYNYTDGVDSDFKREVTVARVVNPCSCELIVTSKVTWVQQGATKTVLAESHLFNWR